MLVRVSTEEELAETSVQNDEGHGKLAESRAGSRRLASALSPARRHLLFPRSRN